MRVLVTGGAGYVGSHIAVELLQRGDEVVVVDSLERGYREAVERASAIAGRPIALLVGDLCDRTFLDAVFEDAPVDAVLHCAAFKSVAESVAHPERYERNNVEATRTLVDAMEAAGVRRMVFSSTGSVYGQPDCPTITEASTLQPLSPYAASKVECERILSALASDLNWGVVNLRFFNVCGAHRSGQLGEFAEKSTNLMPILLTGLRDPHPRVTVFGSDYPTPDGTCIRDYVHVCDVAQANVMALDRTVEPRLWTWNVGTGRGASVLEVVQAVQRASGKAIEAVAGDRRAGDPAAVVADVARARTELGFVTRYALGDMVRTALRWMER